MSMRGGAEGGGFHVAVVGSGGVIGSQLVPHVARTAGVRRLTLVDPDAYDESNVGHQDIERSAVGRPKVAVQADRVRAMGGDLDVVALQQFVEDVPYGRLRADVVLSCPDSRRARQAVNAVAWRLGLPWIDAGVDPGGALARVTVRNPGGDGACVECGWSAADYAAADAEYGCDGRPGRAGQSAQSERPGSTHATRSPTWLGGLAAAMQAAECARLLAVMSAALSASRPAGGWQWVIDATGGSSVVTQFRRNPSCRFGHERWDIEPIARAPADVSLAEALSFAHAREPVDTHAEMRLTVPGRTFAQRVICVACGALRSALVLSHRLQATLGACTECGGALTASAFHDADHISRSIVAAAPAAPASLAALGFLPGDVFEVGGARYELGGPP